MYLINDFINQFSSNLEIHSKRILIALIIVIVIIGFFLFIFLTQGKKKTIKKNVSKKAFERQIKLNIKDSTYSYLDMKKPNAMIVKPLSEFYGLFNLQDQDSIRNWVVSLLDPSSKQNEKIEKYILEKRKKDPYLATFKHIKSNYMDQTIYFNSTIYPLIKKQNNIKTNNTSLVNISDVSKHFEEMKKSKKKGMCILAIHIFNKSDLLIRDFEDEIHNHLLKILNIYQNHTVKNTTYFAKYDNSTLNLIFLKYKSERKVKKQLDLLMKILYDYLSLNNLSSIYDYSIGIYHNKDYEDDLLINKTKRAYQTALFSKNSSSKMKFAYYTKDIFENESYTESLTKEALSILKGNQFVTKYKPFIQLNSGINNITRTRGFIYTIKPKSNIISSLSEFEKIIYDSNEVYNYVKILINNFVTAFQNPSIKKSSIKNVIVRIEPLFLSSVISYFKYNNVEDLSITFLVDENFFLNSKYDILQIKNDFNKIKQLGYNIGINIQNHQSPLSSEILSLFDLFVLDDEILNRYKKNSRISILTKTLIKDLLRYKTPILAKGIKNWIDAELLYSYGVSYFSGDAISKTNESIQEVDKNLSNKMQHIVR